MLQKVKRTLNKFKWWKSWRIQIKKNTARKGIWPNCLYFTFNSSTKFTPSLQIIGLQCIINRLCLIGYRNRIVLPYVSVQEDLKLIWLLSVNSITVKLVSSKKTFFDCFPVICLSQVKTSPLAGGDTKGCFTDLH